MARFVLVFSVWLFVAMLASDPASSQQALQLWNTRTVNCGACSSFAKAWWVEAFSPVIRGYSYPHSRGVVEEFIERTLALVEDYYSGVDVVGGVFGALG